MIILSFVIDENTFIFSMIHELEMMVLEMNQIIDKQNQKIEQ